MRHKQLRVLHTSTIKQENGWISAQRNSLLDFNSTEPATKRSSQRLVSVTCCFLACECFAECLEVELRAAHEATTSHLLCNSIRTRSKEASPTYVFYCRRAALYHRSSYHFKKE